MPHPALSAASTAVGPAAGAQALPQQPASSATTDDAASSDPSSAAYILEWGPDRLCISRSLDDAALISRRRGEDVGTAGAPSSRSIHMPSTATGPHRLFVLRDTDQAQTDRILCALNVDPEFRSAHATGQPYCPRDMRWHSRSRQTDAGGFTGSYVYPQVLTLRVLHTSPVVPDGAAKGPGKDGRTQSSWPSASNTKAPAPVKDQAADTYLPGRNTSRPAGDNRPPKEAAEAVSSPSLNPNDIGDSPVAMFCRASLWAGLDDSLLLLDSNPSSTTLDDALPEALNNVILDNVDVELGMTMADVIDNIVVGLINDQWVNLLDTLGLGNWLSPRGIVNRRLCLDMARFLEQNLVASRTHEKRLRCRQLHWKRQKDVQQIGSLPDNFLPLKDPTATRPDDWLALLSRLERMVALLPLVRRGTTSNDTMQERLYRITTPQTSFTVKRVAEGLNNGLVYPAQNMALSPSGDVDQFETVGRPPPFSTTEEGKAALNRVSYMGGILLPFSIVPGILSLSDPYGPTDRLFWVFWALAIPITLITLIIIYADELRQIYVWEPMNHTSLEDAIKKGEAFLNKLVSDSDAEVETEPVATAIRPNHSWPGTGRKMGDIHVNTTSGPSAPTYYRLTPPTSASVIKTSSLPAIFSMPLGEDEPLVTTIETEGILQEEPAAAEAPRRHQKLHMPKLLGFIFRQRKGKGPAMPPPFAGCDDVEPALPQMAAPAGVEVPEPRPTKESSGLSGASVTPVTRMNIETPGFPAIVLEQRPNGLEPTAWRRQQLGWAGALRTIVRYQKPQKA